MCVFCSVQHWPVSGGPPLFGTRTQCWQLGHALPATLARLSGFQLRRVHNLAPDSAQRAALNVGAGGSLGLELKSHEGRMVECCAGGAESEPAPVSNLGTEYQ